MPYKSWNFSSLTIKNKTGATCTGQGTVKVSKTGRVSVVIDFLSLCPLVNGHVSIDGTDISGISCSGSGTIEKVNMNFQGKSNSFKIELKIIKLNIYGVGVTSDSISWTRKIIYVKNANIQNQSSKSTIGNYDFVLEPVAKPQGVQHWAKGSITLKINAESPSLISTLETDYFHNICSLFSIAQRCPLVPTIIESYNGNNFIIAELIESERDYLSRIPLITWDGDPTLEFLKKTHDAFFNNLTNYGLIYLTEYYWRTHVETTQEIKLLLASMFMEALKFNWASNVSTTLEKDIKGNGLVRGFRDKGGPQSGAGKYKNKTFEELLLLMCHDLNYPAVTGTTFTFIENRNAIFHSGLSTAHQQGNQNPLVVIKPELNRLYDQIDDLFLRVLNFSGTIKRTHQPNQTVSFP